MSELLKSLEIQFGFNTTDITTKLIALKCNQNLTQNKTLFDEINSLLDETNELLEQIDLEVFGSDGGQRGQHLLRLEAFRKEYTKLKTDFINSKKLLTSDDSIIRSELLDVDIEVDSDDQRSRLLGDDIQRMEATDRRLKDGYSLCLESEKIGAEVLEGLHQQRDTIKRSRDRLRGTNHELSRSHKILNIMTRKALQTRVVVYLVFTLILIVFIYLIYSSMV